MKFFIIALIAFTFGVYYPAKAQIKSLNGVYAGCEFSPSPIIGGGTSRRDIVVLFRSDGTFNDYMGAADWKTRVSGKYTINGSKVTLNYAKGSSQYTIKSETALYGYGYDMFKLQGEVIPPGYYKFTRAMGGGGGASAMVYVGALNTGGLNFDGNGHFSNSRSSAVLISGANVGGGSSSGDSGSGTYKIKDGLLTLTFANGKTEMHSFFSDKPGTKSAMAVVDGSVYFLDNKSTAANTSAAKAKPTATTSSQNNIQATSQPANATDGMSLLIKANNVHGGDKLDNLKTAKLTASVMGMKAVEFIDLANNKVRVELWKNGKLNSVQQTEGDNGWQWANGSKSTLSPDKIAETKSTLYAGVLGLRKPVLDNMQILNIQKAASNNIYTVQCKLNGNTYVFALNDQNQLVAYGYNVAGKTSTSVLTDMRPVQGITLPFHEVSTSGQQKLNIQYDNIELNPVFDDSSWKVPTGN
ncbi:MAG: hypothetical protein AAGC65_16850 [Mucilaginibacter sp.]|uniref:hypothetical protein n=1 Tax=Mucilaginibacter sp. TaxID=1882438 RepID=UPI0031A51289